jgi:DNA-binding transcriptional MerR regulator
VNGKPEYRVNGKPEYRASGKPEYRVSELAREAGTSVRNVRVYQDRGLLPPPVRHGRIGLYDDDHLARLRLIGRLLARGWTFATIRELFDAWTGGRDLAETLGLRDLTPGPVAEPARVARTDLMDRLGGQLTPAILERAVELGLLIPLSPTGATFAAPAPELPSAAGRLVATGVSAEEVLELAAAVSGDLSRIAHQVAGWLEASARSQADSDTPAEPHDTAEPHQTAGPNEISGPNRRAAAEYLMEALLRAAIRRRSDQLSP